MEARARPPQAPVPLKRAQLAVEAGLDLLGAHCELEGAVVREVDDLGLAQRRRIGRRVGVVGPAQRREHAAEGRVLQVAHLAQHVGLDLVVARLLAGRGAIVKDGQVGDLLADERVGAGQLGEVVGLVRVRVPDGRTWRDAGIADQPGPVRVAGELREDASLVGVEREGCEIVLDTRRGRDENLTGTDDFDARRAADQETAWRWVSYMKLLGIEGGLRVVAVAFGSGAVHTNDVAAGEHVLPQFCLCFLIKLDIVMTSASKESRLNTMQGGKIQVLENID